MTRAPKISAQKKQPISILRNKKYLYQTALTLCTYQCNAPLPQVRAEVGEGGDCVSENYNSPPSGEVLAIQTPTYPRQISQ